MLRLRLPEPLCTHTYVGLTIIDDDDDTGSISSSTGRTAQTTGDSAHCLKVVQLRLGTLHHGTQRAHRWVVGLRRGADARTQLHPVAARGRTAAGPLALALPCVTPAHKYFDQHSVPSSPCPRTSVCG